MTITSQGSVTGVPVGMINWYPAATPPDGWLICNGQSTAGYLALAAVVGANVPDLRGEFIRGADLGRGVDSGRTFASTQDWAIENITGTINWGDGNEGAFNGTGAFYTDGTYVWQGGSGAHLSGSRSAGKGMFDTSKVVKTANETRPRNIALLPCIKY